MEDEVSLSAFFRMVRDHPSRLPSAGSNNTIEETVDILLEEKSIDKLDLDVSFNEEVFENTVIDALVASQRIDEMCIHNTMEVNFLLRFLRRVLGTMTSVHALAFLGCPMSTAEANQLFTLLRKNTNIQKLGFFVIEQYDDGVIDALKGYIQDSSCLTCLALGSYGSDVPLQLPNEQFSSVCEAAERCTSLQVLLLALTGSDVEQATKTVARMVVSSSSLGTFWIEQDIGRNWTMNHIEQALLRTSAFQNCEMTFRTFAAENDGLIRMNLTRTTKWRSLLNDDDVRLSYWPRILAKANSWNQETSHSSRDAVYLLVKEKHDVLLQNVRKRKIRKRKHFQLS